MVNSNIFLVGLFTFLFGCGKSTNYRQKNGAWYFKDIPVTTEKGDSFTPLTAVFAKSSRIGYYRDAGITGSDGKSFEALSDHYAKDKAHVYYCDTYRKGQEYFSIKHNRIDLLKDADPVTFGYLSSDYAKDKSTVFFEGFPFPVKDVQSFKVDEYGFAKDKISAYYHQAEIAGSDGSSFSVISNYYSKDKIHVYYSDISRSDADKPYLPNTILLQGADPLSFKSFDYGYAADTNQVYYKSTRLTAAAGNFRVFAYDYAAGDKVYYRGGQVAGADVSSFITLDTPSDTADAKDKNSFYLQGKKIR